MTTDKKCFLSILLFLGSIVKAQHSNDTIDISIRPY